MAESIDKICETLNWLSVDTSAEPANVVMRGELHFVPNSNEPPAILLSRIADQLDKINKQNQQNRRSEARALRRSRLTGATARGPESKVSVSSLLNPTPLDDEDVYIQLYPLRKSENPALKGTLVCNWICSSQLSVEKTIEAVCASAKRLGAQLDCDVTVVDAKARNLMFKLRCSAQIDTAALSANPFVYHDKGDINGTTNITVQIDRKTANSETANVFATVFESGIITLCGCQDQSEAEDAIKKLKTFLAPFAKLTDAQVNNQNSSAVNNE